MTGRRRRNSSLQRWHPHPTSQRGPWGELPYSQEGARSSGRAWHSQVDVMAPDIRDDQKICSFFCLQPLTEPTLHFLFSSVALKLRSGSFRKSGAVVLGVPQTHDVSTQPTEHTAESSVRLTDATTHSLTTQTPCEVHTRTTDTQSERFPSCIPQSTPVFTSLSLKFLLWACQHVQEPTRARLMN